MSISPIHMSCWHHRDGCQVNVGYFTIAEWDGPNLLGDYPLDAGNSYAGKFS